MLKYHVKISKQVHNIQRHSLSHLFAQLRKQKSGITLILFNTQCNYEITKLGVTF